VRAEVALRQQSTIALGLAAASAMSEGRGNRWEAAASLERQLVLQLHEGGEGAGSSIAQVRASNAVALCLG